MTKLLLIPIAVVAFLIFLIVLGAIGLAIAFILLATLGKIWQVIAVTARVISRRGRRQRT